MVEYRLLSFPSNVTIETQPSPGTSRARRLLVPIAKTVVSLALLWVLFSRVDVARLWGVARHASAPWLLGALGLYLADGPDERLALGSAASRPGPAILVQDTDGLVPRRDVLQ